MTTHAERSTPPPHVMAEVQRILDAEARRRLQQRLRASSEGDLATPSERRAA